MIQFFVPGKPEPGGSKRAVPTGRRRGGDGSMMVRLVDANKKVGPWKKSVADIARATMQPRAPLEGALHVELGFVLERPKTVSRHLPTVKPDVLKLARAVEDALSGIVYDDDAQIVTEQIGKVYGPTPGVYVSVEQL